MEAGPAQNKPSPAKGKRKVFTFMVAQMQRNVKWRKDPPPFLTGKPTRTAENIRMERSALLTAEMAQRACLALNALPSVVTAVVKRDHNTRIESEGDARFYVRWIRKTGADLTPDQQKMQFTRAERAARQFHEMAFFPCEDEAGAVWCVHTYPDRDECGIYLLRPDLSRCNCPDWEYRHLQTGDCCKHLQAHAIHFGETNRPRLFPKTEEGKAARREWALTSRNLDF